MNKNIIFCVISSCDLKKAYNMINTFLKHNVGWDSIIYKIGNFDTYGIKSENISNFATKNMFNDFEKCECLRFKMASQLLKTYEKVLYCDSDIMFFDKIPEYNKPICLTKHILNVNKINNYSSYIDRYSVGGFINIGFMLFNKHNDSIKFCDEIFSNAEKRKHCSIDRHNKIRLQPVVSYIPYMGFDYCFINEPGVNVAYWRLDGDVNITEKYGKFFVNGCPLVCFHFSGYVGDDRLCRHNNRTISSYGNVVQKILSLYRDSVKHEIY